MARKAQPLGRGIDDVDAEWREQAKNAPRLRRARGVVVARNHDDNRVGKALQSRANCWKA